MDLASVVAALASVGARVSGSAPNSSVRVDSSRACPPGLAGPEPSGTIHDLGQHFQDDTAAKVCKACQDEHEKRAKYFKQGKVQKSALGDNVWVERHHKDVLSRHRQASWYVPGVIVRRVGQDLCAVRVGDNKILDRDHT